MTSYFKIQRCPNRKQNKEKILHGSGEIAKEKQDWKKMEANEQMKRQVQVYENLKLGD